MSPIAEAIDLDVLRARVANVVTASRPAGPSWATSIATLDDAIGGGIPRGRITEVTGAMGSGRATLVRQAVQNVLKSGGWVAWVDACRTAAPHSWVGLGSRMVMIRPPQPRKGAWCADLLLRSGVFALVVLDGAPALSRVQGVRLSGLARECDVAFVIVTDTATTSRIGGAMRLRVEQNTVRDTRDMRDMKPHRLHLKARTRDTNIHHANDSPHPSHFSHSSGQNNGFVVVVEKGGINRTVEVKSAVVVARRLCENTEIPDRRGVAHGTRRPWAPTGGYTDDATPSITWGGLGASVGKPVTKVNGSQSKPHSQSHDRSHGRSHDATGASAATLTERISRSTLERAQRDLDKRTRDWTTYRGRRRAAESNYGRRSRRDEAKARINELALGHAPAGAG